MVDNLEALILYARGGERTPEAIAGLYAVGDFFQVLIAAHTKK
jgi:hypothetical protein